MVDTRFSRSIIYTTEFSEDICASLHTYTYNESTHTEREEDEILTVKYEDGRWSKPYYDCGGGNIWMLTYTVPFFGYVNDTYFFKYSTQLLRSSGTTKRRLKRAATSYIKVYDLLRRNLADIASTKLS
ncbi:hypothetical protein HZH68_010522 [Vespula germanica]|uniref:Uncharacterized protein n=3 Tax=Vespula TaxID=7451 RepID=A0A834JRT2_VESGE|nr:hypothetical protein HZH68_010522 [Vespula germanica]KAF7416863.1 hypothetical protein H0235_011394 [Vespula pensylvanica]